MLTLHRKRGGDREPRRELRLLLHRGVLRLSLLFFVVLAAAVTISRACAITGAVVLLLGLVGWLAATGNGPAAPGVRLVVQHWCACGLADAAIAALLPTFA